MNHQERQPIPVKDTLLEDGLKRRLNISQLVELQTMLYVPKGGNRLSGRSHTYTIDDKTKIYVKTNGCVDAQMMYDGECESLKHIAATKTILLPKPLTVIHDYDSKNTSAIVMEYLRMVPLQAERAKSLGGNLADLHDYNYKLTRYNEQAASWVGKAVPSDKPILAASVGNNLNEEGDSERQQGLDEKKEEQENRFENRPSMRVRPDNVMAGEEMHSDKSSTIGWGTKVEAPVEKFVPKPNTEQIDAFGFHVSTLCNSTPQSNDWSRDWISFFATQRLDHIIRIVCSKYAFRQLDELWSQLQLKLPKFFSDLNEDDLVPSLLHGDLWKGNLAQLADNTAGIIYDPASFYGHSEYEFGIARLFGAIPIELEQAYFEKKPKRRLFEQRNKLYQLYHSLTHWNQFGDQPDEPNIPSFKTNTISTLMYLNDVKL